MLHCMQGRIAAIATAQRAWLISAPPLQTALRNFLDVIAPDADETLARYSRDRVKFDAFRSEVVRILTTISSARIRRMWSEFVCIAFIADRSRGARRAG